MPLSAGGTGRDENLFWCARYAVLVSVPVQGYYFLDIHVPSCRTVLLTLSRLHFVIGLPLLCVLPIVSDIWYGLHNITEVGSAFS